VPELALEGSLDIEGALVLDDVSDDAKLRDAHAQGTPVVVRALTAEADQDRTRAGPRWPRARADEELLALDLTELTYG
jgi:hypothetical protein